jgi:hypothetical protein
MPRLLSRLGSTLVLSLIALTCLANPREIHRQPAPLVIRDEVNETASAPPMAVAQLRPAVSGDETGAAVSAAGDVNGDGYSDYLVASPGANGLQGKVEIYAGNSSGVATLLATLVPDDASGRFGQSVAPAGDVDKDGYDDVLVGEPHFSSDLGRVFLYRGGPVGMTLDTVLVGVDPSAMFGFSVSTAGDVNGDGYDDVVIGAPLASGGAGKAFIYQGGPTGITGLPVVTLGTQSGQNRGYAVAGVGDVNADGYADVAVGAPYTLGGDPGRVFLFRGSATGVHVASDSLSGVTTGDRFGYSVSPIGDYDQDGYADLLVGAPFASSESGRAYGFHGTAAGIATSPFLTTSEVQAGAHMGWSVGTAGDANGDGYADVVVGEPGYDGPAGADQGRAFLFYGTRGGGSNPAVNFLGPAAGSQFGISVSGVGDVSADGFTEMAIGSPVTVTGGTVSIFKGAVAVAARISPLLYIPDPQQGAASTFARFGESVAAGGDFNGDGFDDALAGVPAETNLVPGEGVVYVFRGLNGPSSLFDGAVGILHSNQGNSLFGESCAIAGDVNGDGYDDAIVGAPLYTISQSNEGAAFLYLGGPAGLDTNAAVVWPGGAPGRRWGSSVAGAGDLNGDGYADVAIGSPWDGSSAGKVSIYLGGPTNPSTVSALDVFGQAAGDSLGFCVAPAGDVNADGYDDLVIGAPGASGRAGSVVIVFGGASPPFATATLNSTLGAGKLFGFSVAGRGDVDGDGFADVAIGAPHASPLGGEDGVVEIHRGKASGLASVAQQTLIALQSGSHFGAAVSWGDVSGDGFSDLVVGAPEEDANTVDQGTVRVYLADGTGVLSAIGFVLSRTNTSVFGRGYSVTANGDMNSDGFADVVFGAPNSVFEGTQSGAMEHAAGGGTFYARDRLARSRRADESAPIALEGGTNATGDFNLHLRARTAAGRHDFNAQVQVANVSQSFASLPILNAGVASLGTPDPTDGLYSDQTLGFANRPAGSRLKWHVRVHTRSPWFPFTPWLTRAGNASTLTDLVVPASLVAADPAPVARLSLAPATPNPSRGAVSFSYRLSQPSEVELGIYDVAGRLVRVVDRGMHVAGPATSAWDGNDAAGRKERSGVFFVRLRVGQETLTRRFVRL